MISQLQRSSSYFFVQVVVALLFVVLVIACALIGIYARPGIVVLSQPLLLLLLGRGRGTFLLGRGSRTLIADHSFSYLGEEGEGKVELISICTVYCKNHDN